MPNGSLRIENYRLLAGGCGLGSGWPSVHLALAGCSAKDECGGLDFVFLHVDAILNADDSDLQIARSCCASLRFLRYDKA
jgi:hypothetical protein